MATNFNIITFEPTNGGGEVALLFDSDFKWSAGLKPDVNVAKVSYLEMQKLGGNYAQTGSLNFYFTSSNISDGDDDDDDGDDSGDPDFSIENIRIIEVKPTRFGVPLGGSGVQPIEWEIHFADWRYGFVAPRGGRLRWGVINPTNVQPIDTADPNLDSSSTQNPNGTQDDPIPCSQLIQMCLDAMNQSGISYDPGVDDTDPPLDLQWHGTHAPTELEKLLDHVGAVFCPHFDGTATIELISNTGTDPDVPAAQLMGSFPIGALDHRGTTVVFSSAPTPILNTLNIIGIDGTTWEYVVQDFDKTWKNINDSPPPAILLGFDPVQLIQQNFVQLTTTALAQGSTNQQQPGAASDGIVYLHTLKSQLYHCIRLNPSYYPPSLQPILHQRLEAPASGSTAPIPARPLVTATIAILPPDGLSIPYNSTAPVDCNAHLHNNECILTCHARLGLMETTARSPGSRMDFDLLFQPLGSGQLTGRITQEKLDDNQQPVYYESAFNRDVNGNVIALGDQDGSTSNLLDSPDDGTIMVARPDFQLLNVDGADTNRSDLDSKSKALAAFYLADAQNQAREVHAVGFIGTSDLSGSVGEIRISQKEVKTVFTVNMWWRPHSPLFKAWRTKLAHGNGGPTEAFPQQHLQQTKRTQLGLSGSTQPSVPLNTKGDLPAIGEFVTVTIIGTETGGGIYQGSVLTGASNGSTSSSPGSANFQLQAAIMDQETTDGPAPQTNSDGTLVNNALVMNLSEPYVNGTHLLWGDSLTYRMCAMGRVMGFTSETNPRTIVYLDKTPFFPIIAKITGIYSLNPGVYYGRTLQGQFCNASNFGYEFPLSDLNPAYLPDVDNCWITNQWEQTYGKTNTTPAALAVGTYIWGFVVGFPAYSFITSGNSNSYNTWYQVYTWFPVQSATLVHPVENLVTTETADSTYTTNEQNMLNDLKTDTENIQAALKNLYANLKAAGYSL